ncbi:MAG: GNAT family N-acetyltransferase [Candidatus Pacebacteria bacterium]|nr:GNAT family N-acetyltransferase [Candidatus Paceibacterota bacterium]
MGNRLITIVDAIPNDVYVIRNIRKLTWLVTYPNKKFGISKKDIENKFPDDTTKIAKKKIEEGKRQFLDPTIHTYVAKEKNIIIGFCGVKKEEKNNRIGAIYLLPKYQNKGIGRKLMKMAMHWLGNERDIYVNVASYNEKAIRFYEKFGFVQTGKIVNDSAGVLPSGKIIPEIEMLLNHK